MLKGDLAGPWMGKRGWHTGWGSIFLGSRLDSKHPVVFRWGSAVSPQCWDSQLAFVKKNFRHGKNCRPHLRLLPGRHSADPGGVFSKCVFKIPPKRSATNQGVWFHQSLVVDGRHGFPKTGRGRNGLACFGKRKAPCEECSRKIWDPPVLCSSPLIISSQAAGRLESGGTMGQKWTYLGQKNFWPAKILG